MKPKAIVRIGIDIGMTVLLLLLMAYELIGSSLHEWIGLAMFVLFVCHHPHPPQGTAGGRVTRRPVWTLRLFPPFHPHLSVSAVAVCLFRL